MIKGLACRFILFQFQMIQSLVVEDSNENVVTAKGRGKFLVYMDWLRVDVHAFIIVSSLIEVSVLG